MNNATISVPYRTDAATIAPFDLVKGNGHIDQTVQHLGQRLNVTVALARYEIFNGTQVRYDDKKHLYDPDKVLKSLASAGMDVSKVKGIRFNNKKAYIFFGEDLQLMHLADNPIRVYERTHLLDGINAVLGLYQRGDKREGNHPMVGSDLDDLKDLEDPISLAELARRQQEEMAEGEGDEMTIDDTVETLMVLDSDPSETDNLE